MAQLKYGYSSSRDSSGKTSYTDKSGKSVSSSQATSSGGTPVKSSSGGGSRSSSGSKSSTPASPMQVGQGVGQVSPYTGNVVKEVINLDKGTVQSTTGTTTTQVRSSSGATNVVAGTPTVSPQATYQGQVGGVVYKDLTEKEILENKLAPNTQAQILASQTAQRQNVVAVEEKIKSGEALTSQDLLMLQSKGKGEVAFIESAQGVNYVPTGKSGTELQAQAKERLTTQENLQIIKQNEQIKKEQEKLAEPNFIKDYVPPKETKTLFTPASLPKGQFADVRTKSIVSPEQLSETGKRATLLTGLEQAQANLYSKAYTGTGVKSYLASGGAQAIETVTEIGKAGEKIGATAKYAKTLFTNPMEAYKTAESAIAVQKAITPKTLIPAIKSSSSFSSMSVVGAGLAKEIIKKPIKTGIELIAFEGAGRLLKGEKLITPAIEKITGKISGFKIEKIAPFKPTIITETTSPMISPTNIPFSGVKAPLKVTYTQEVSGAINRLFGRKADVVITELADGTTAIQQTVGKTTKVIYQEPFSNKANEFLYKNNKLISQREIESLKQSEGVKKLIYEAEQNAKVSILPSQFQRGVTPEGKTIFEEIGQTLTQKARKESIYGFEYKIGKQKVLGEISEVGKVKAVSESTLGKEISSSQLVGQKIDYLPEGYSPIKTTAPVGRDIISAKQIEGTLEIGTGKLEGKQLLAFLGKDPLKVGSLREPIFRGVELEVTGQKSIIEIPEIFVETPEAISKVKTTFKIAGEQYKEPSFFGKVEKKITEAVTSPKDYTQFIDKSILAKPEVKQMIKEGKSISEILAEQRKLVAFKDKLKMARFVIEKSPRTIKPDSSLKQTIKESVSGLQGQKTIQVSETKQVVKEQVAPLRKVVQIQEVKVPKTKLELPKVYYKAETKVAPRILKFVPSYTRPITRVPTTKTTLATGQSIFRKTAVTPIQKITPTTLTSTSQKSEVSQILEVTPITKTESAVEQIQDIAQIQKQEQRLKQTEDYLFKPTTRFSPFFIPKEPVKKVKLPFLLPKEDKKKKRGYQVEVRSKGLFKTLKDTFGTKEEAMGFGAERIQKSAMATFKIKPIETEETKAFGKRIDYSKFYSKKEKGENLYIQKTKFRISSAEEKKEITYKGIESRKRKTLFG